MADDTDKAIIKKNCLSIKLVAETEEDRHLASLIKLINPESFEERQERIREEIDARPVLPLNGPLISATQPIVSSLSRNFSFGDPGHGEKLLSPTKLGIVPKSHVRRKDGEDIPEPKPSILTTDADLKGSGDKPATNVLQMLGVADYGSSDSE